MDPRVDIRPVEGQVDDLLGEIRARVEQTERVLVTTLTKRMAEDLTEYYTELNVRCRYLHSDIDTLERVKILRDSATGGVRRPDRNQPPPGRARPSRGVAGRYSGCRQGGLSSLGWLSHPNYRTCRPQRRGHRDSVCRQNDGLDEAGDR